jgi:hypothetical protein
MLEGSARKLPPATLHTSSASVRWETLQRHLWHPKLFVSGAPDIPGPSAPPPRCRPGAFSGAILGAPFGSHPRYEGQDDEGENGA